MSEIQNINHLAQDRELTTLEIHQPNDFYGHATILKKFVGIQANYQIKTAIEHGVYLKPEGWKVDWKSPLPSMFTLSSFRFRHLKKLTGKRLHAIGPYVHYAKPFLNVVDTNKQHQRFGNSLLVFPAHSTHWVDVEYNIHQYCKKLETIGKSFDSIRICLYWKDILKGVAKIYRLHGFECVTAGHIYDSQFLPRLKSIIESATITTSNDISTAIGYCITMGKPHFLLQSEIERTSQIKKFLDECADNSKNIDAIKIREAFMTGLRSDITPEQFAVVEKYWGKGKEKTKEELKKIFEQSERLYKRNINSPSAHKKLTSINDNKQIKNHSINIDQNHSTVKKTWHVADHRLIGGAAIAGYRLFKGLEAVQTKVKMIPFCDPTNPENACFNWVQTSNMDRYKISSNTKRLKVRSKSDWLEIVSAALATDSPQIINIHNIHEAIHYHGVPFDVLDLMAKNSYIVFTLHDMWLFTGRCAYNGGCKKFVDHSCNETCPTPTVYPQAHPKDISGLLRWKIDFFKRNPHAVIVTPSNWLEKQARKSYLREHRIEVIPYGIDTSIFCPDSDRDGLRRSIGIPERSCVLLISAANLSDRRKGALLLLKALSNIKDELMVLTVGKSDIQPDLPENIKFYNYGYVNSPEEMAFAYTIADLFICPSLEDNLPCVLIESISCGTPCIGFNIGGVPEIIRPKKTGWIVPEVTPESLSKLITDLLKDPGKISDLRPSCREVAKKEYALNIQAERYLKLYQELIGQDSNTLRLPCGRKNNREDHLESKFKEIKKYIDIGEIESANLRLEKLVEIYPDFATGHNDLGVLAYKEGMKDEAFKHYSAAVKLQPENIVFLKNLADYYYVELGKIEEAMQLYVKVLRIEPKDIETLLFVGTLCVSLEKFSEAKNFYERIIEIDPDHEEARNFIERLKRKLSEITRKQNDEEKPLVNDLKNLNDIDSDKYLVSAIVSTYNAEKFIRGCLDDLESQTIADRLEIIVINSGSTESEEAIVREFQTKYENIKYIRSDKRETVYAAWNRGIKAATGKYTTNANTDDRHRKDAYEIMVKTLEKHQSVSLVYADVIITEKENETLDKCSPVGYFRWLNWNRDDLLDKGCFMGPQPMWRREIHKEYGYFDESFVTSGDYEFWLRISQTKEFLHIPEILGLYLRSSDSIEHTNRKMQAVENERILRMYKNAHHAGKVIRKNWSSNKSTRYISKNPKHTKPQLLVPESLYRDIISETSIDRPKTTINKLEKLLKEFPDFAVVHNELGVLHYKYGSDSKVLAHYLKAVELEPENVTFRKNLADFLFVEEGRVEEALENYIEVLRIKPDDIDTLLITGHICTAIERFEDALSFYQKVLDIEPQNLEARQNLEALEKRKVLMFNQEARDSEKIGDDTEVNQVEPHLSIDEAPKVQAGVVEDLIKKADALFQQERIDQAVDIFLKAIAVNPLDGSTYIELAGQLVNHGRHESALEVLTEMPANLPEALAMQKLLLEGYSQEGMGNYAAAKKCSDRVIEREPENAKALNLGGILAYRNGDKETAEQHFKRAIELNPEYGEPHTNLGALVWEKGDPKMALKHYERGFSLSPTDLDVANAYQEAVTATGEKKRAEKVARNTLKRYPHCRKVHYLLIDMLIRQEKTEETLKGLENALSTLWIDEELLDTALAFRERVGKNKKTGSAKRPGVSLCMIVKDEENNLARCLASVKPIVDEMVIVDTGSTDRTRDIAEFFGARVYEFEWSDNFAEARNFSLSKAKGDWILIMDADEIISPQDYGRFRKLVAKKPSRLTAYSVITRNYCNMVNTIGWIPNTGQYGSEEAGLGWLSSEKVRLFSKSRQIKFEGAVHEMVDPVLKRLSAEIKKCPILVHHYGRLNADNLAHKHQAYYEIGLKKLQKNGGEIGTIRELATQAAILERFSEAIDLWLKFLSMEPGEAAVAFAYVNMVSVYIRMQEYGKAIELARKAVSMAPQMKEAQYNLGITELYNGNVEAAFNTFKKLTDSHPDFPPAQFLLAASNYCRNGATEAKINFRQIKQSAFGPTLTYSVTELAEGLMTANQHILAFGLLKKTIEEEIVSKAIMKLYAECLVKIKTEDLVLEQYDVLPETMPECN